MSCIIVIIMYVLLELQVVEQGWNRTPTTLPYTVKIVSRDFILPPFAFDLSVYSGVKKKQQDITNICATISNYCIVPMLLEILLLVKSD